MFGEKDKTYDDVRDKSISQWLEGMSQHEDVEVRGGVRVTRDYMDDLKKTIMRLEEKNTLKDKYLKKLMGKNQ